MLSRSVSRRQALVLGTALALPLAAVTQTAEAKSKTQTFSNTGAITIPDSGNANPFPSTIQVSGFKKGKIQDVTVTLNGFSHTLPEEVGVLLQAPNGDTAILMNGAGGGTDVTNLTITFDDSAGAVLPNNGPLTSGTFRPSVYEFPSNSTAPYVPLTGFNGSNPNGTWQLFVFDNAAMDSGSISGGWSLQIQAQVEKKKKKKKKKK